MATTTKSARGPVLAAIYAALNVAAITTTLGCGVWDDVPQGSSFPYLRISTPTGLPFDTFGRAGKDRTVMVDVFSQYEGKLEAQNIIDKVIELLQYQALAISGHSTVTVQYDQDGEGEDEDIKGRKTVHLWVRFKVMVQES